MKKVKITLSFLLLILLCVIFQNFLMLFNYIIALILHELAHLFISLKCGYKLKQFKLSMFGVCVELDEKIDDKNSFAINIAGPVFNLFLCLVCLASYWLFPITFKVLNNFCIANLTLAVFNLLPIYPLDGGKIFASMFKNNKSYKLFDKIVRYFLCSICLILFVVSCFYKANWFLCVIAVFFITSKPREENKLTIFKYASNKKIEKVVLLKITGEENLFELLKKINCKNYTIFYLNKNSHFINEDEIIELSTKFPLISKVKEVFENF